LRAMTSRPLQLTSETQQTTLGSLDLSRIDVGAGQVQVTYTVSAFPYVPPLVAEIQPQDYVQTKLDEYVVS